MEDRVQLGCVVVEDLISHIRSSLDTLRPAERRVANAVLMDLESATRSSIAELAARAEVSEPTVTRFCRATGCAGLRDFKIRLAQGLALGTPFLHETVRSDDETTELVDKVFEGVARGLERVREHLDPDALKLAIEAIARADRVNFHGVGGGSNVVAQDAQLRFFRLDMTANAFTDGHLQRMSASIVDEHDVVVAISHTGRTREVLESVLLARKHGATTIGITRPRSPLARVCNIALPVNAPENTDVYTPSISRLAHLVVIDMLTIGVAARRGPEVLSNLRKIKASLTELRVGDEEAESMLKGL